MKDENARTRLNEKRAARYARIRRRTKRAKIKEHNDSQTDTAKVRAK